MSELLKKQNYGVEVEFTGISRKIAADAVAEIIGTTASRPDHTCYQTRTIQDSQGRKWKVMRDSSINPIRKVGTENMDEYRVEFVTPVLKYEDLDTLQAIIRKFRETNHPVCRISTHIHDHSNLGRCIKRTLRRCKFFDHTIFCHTKHLIPSFSQSSFSGSVRFRSPHLMFERSF